MLPSSLPRKLRAQLLSLQHPCASAHPPGDGKDGHLLLRDARSIETVKPKMSLAFTLISDLCLFFNII